MAGLPADSSNVSRPLIDFVGGKFRHSGYPCRVVARRGKISVGCSDVTPVALMQLLQEYEKRFGSDRDVEVIQP